MFHKIRNSRLVLFALIIPLIFTSCRRGILNGNAPRETLEPVPASPTADPTALPYQSGRNDYTITVDNTSRTFIVHVSADYDANQPTPLLFMFHGTNQNGNVMYESTGWVAQAEAENMIVVFPSSWEYFVTADNRKEEKWNSAGVYRIVTEGTELKDDVRFVRAILDHLKLTFNVDEKRIFASGFSNGGGFVISRLMLEMNDTFAAFTTCGAGMLEEALPDQIPTGINTSLFSVLGSMDEKISERIGSPLPLPTIAEEIASFPAFNQMNTNVLTALSLDPSYQVEYQKPAFTILTFDQSKVGAGNEYIFLMVKNMGHVYPSGDNNRYGLDIAPLFWEFLMKHPLK